MAESFGVGEIAILTDMPAFCRMPDGTEVTITGPAIHREWICLPLELECAGVAYLCRLPDGEEWAIRPRFLRKRRPPQDWVTLCNLADSPRELETA